MACQGLSAKLDCVGGGWPGLGWDRLVHKGDRPIPNLHMIPQ